MGSWGDREKQEYEEVGTVSYFTESAVILWVWQTGESIVTVSLWLPPWERLWLAFISEAERL